LDRLIPFLVMGLSYGMRALQAIVLSVLIARVYGPQEFGEVSYALALCGLFLPVFELGQRLILVREFSRNIDAADRWLSVGIFSKVICSLLICAVLYFVTLAHQSTETGRLVLMISLSYLFRSLEPYEHWCIARRDFRPAAIATSLGFLAMTLFVGLAAWLNCSISITLLCYSLSFGVYSVTICILAKRRASAPRIVWRPDFAVLRAMLIEAFPLILSSIAVSLYMRLDILMLKPWHGDIAVAVYAAALRLSQGLYMIPTILADAVYPSLLRATSSGTDERAAWQSSMNQQLLVALLLLIPSLAFGPLLLTLIFGERYAASGGVFRVHVISLLFVSLGTVSSRYLIARGQQKFVGAATFAGLIANLLLNLLLIPPYSAYGAAVATAVSQACASCLFYGVLKSTRPLFRLQVQSFRDLPRFHRAFRRNRSKPTCPIHS
jgi:PST family polysaccharide transporter